MDGPLRSAKFLLLVTQLADPSICDASATVSTFLFVQTYRPAHQQLDQTRQTDEMSLHFLAARFSRFSSVPSTIRYVLLENFQSDDTIDHCFHSFRDIFGLCFQRCLTP
jgi:hypothetical protein